MQKIEISEKDFIEILSGIQVEHSSENIKIFENFIGFTNVSIIGGTVSLRDIEIKKAVMLNGGYYGAVVFADVLLNEYFNINDGVFSSLIIENIETQGNGSFSIYGGKFAHVVQIRGGKYNKNFSISGGDFNGGLEVSGGVFNEEFGLVGGTFRRWVKFSKCKVLKNIFIQEAVFSYGLEINYGNFNKIHVWNCPGLKFLTANGHGETVVKHLFIRSDTRLQAYFTNCLIEYLDFTSTSFPLEVVIAFVDCKIDHVNFSKFYNFGTLSFANIEPSLEPPELKRIKMNDSNLGRIDFVNIDLDKYIINYKDTRIDEISIVGGNFTRPISAEGHNSWIQEKLFYGQLRKIYDKIGNVPNSIDANSNFMNSHFRQLSNDKFCKLSYEEKFEWINIRLNKCTNNHGKSTSTAFMAFLITSTVLYFTFLFCVGFRLDFFSGNSWCNFLNICSYFFEFINPIHNSDFLSQTFPHIRTNWITRLIDGFSRIAISFTIYQFVQAFRKYGRA
jgi:hypothetical protein